MTSHGDARRLGKRVLIAYLPVGRRGCMNLATRDALLRQAEYLIRTRGYAAFSFADLAQGCGIRKASVHHYFPRKEDLAATLVGDHIAHFQETLEAISRTDIQTQARLTAYAHLFLNGFESGMLPLCGALSAESAALPVKSPEHCTRLLSPASGLAVARRRRRRCGWPSAPRYRGRACGAAVTQCVGGRQLSRVGLAGGGACAVGLP